MKKNEIHALAKLCGIEFKDMIPMLAERGINAKRCEISFAISDDSDRAHFPKSKIIRAAVLEILRDLMRERKVGLFEEAPCHDDTLTGCIRQSQEE